MEGRGETEAGRNGGREGGKGSREGGRGEGGYHLNEFILASVHAVLK